MNESFHDALFQSAQKYSGARLWLSMILLCVLLVGAFASGKWPYYCGLISLALQITSWILADKIRKCNQLAHDLQIVSLCEKYLRKINQQLVLSNLHAQATLLVAPLTKNPQKNVVSETNIYENESFILLKAIHENIFWNQHAYIDASKKYLIKALCPVLVLASLVLIALPFLDNSPLDLILRITFSFFSLAILYEILDISINFKRASDAMHRLEMEAISLVNNPTIESVMLLLGRYHYWKSSCGSVPKRTYDALKEGLNQSWKKLELEVYGLKRKLLPGVAKPDRVISRP